MDNSKYIELWAKYGECIEDDLSPKMGTQILVNRRIHINNDVRDNSLLITSTNEATIHKTENIENNKSKDSYIEDLLTDTRERHLRIIGYAGVGKSTYINENYSYHDYLLLAYTRIAASQINGSTISSTFKLGPRNETSVINAIKSMKRFTPHIYEHIQLSKGLVIDEFYTTPAAVMEKVNTICKLLRECTESFGGMQLILVGDHRQTESIDNAFVDSELYLNLDIKEIILPEHPRMRLSTEYMSFCNTFRNPKLNRNKMIRLLQDSRFAKEEVKDAYTVYYTNAEVDTRNDQGMRDFEGDVVYQRHGKKYKKNCPIYIKSNWGSICNGMMGFLRGKDKKNLLLEIEGNIYTVKPSDLDFAPGFAMTIHKIQSKSFPGINVYVRKSDVFKNRSLYIRLLYVALTRVRHFDRCYISLY